MRPIFWSGAWMDKRKKGPVSVTLVGIGGMGFYYAKALLEDFSREKVNLLTAVDPYPERSALFKELKRKNIPVYPLLHDALDPALLPDLVVISSPLQYHVEQSLQAIEAGCHVLCEKPLAATIQDADRLIRDKAGQDQWIGMGYQWSYTAAIQELKRDIMGGRFGKPVRAKAFYLWPRDAAYYSRNDWAGRLKDKDGRWVLDSPAQSAMAHDLHNLLYLLGDEVSRSAEPVEILAELYRAYPIENYDTVACRAVTREGIELLFYASHATPETRGPFFSLEFEKATVSYGEETKEIMALTSTGAEITYGSPESENPFKKLVDAVAAVRNPRSPVCGPEAARVQTLCVNGIQDSVDEIIRFSRPMLQQRKGECWAEGLSEAFYSCYKEGTLPGESGFSWAHPGKRVRLEGYRFFPGGTLSEGGGGKHGQF